MKSVLVIGLGRFGKHIVEKLKPVRDWFDRLQIREKIEALKGKAAHLWNSIFRKP